MPHLNFSTFGLLMMVVMISFMLSVFVLSEDMVRD